VQCFARRTAEIFCLASALLAGPWSAGAWAQVGAPVAQGPRVPPVLLEQTEAIYPEQALREGLEATVGLQLTIDVEGRVAEATVIEPAGHGFDEAARLAALNFRFTPARQGARPVRARIRYPFAFKLPAAPAPPVVEAPVVAELPPAVETPTSAPVQASAPEPPPVDVQVQGKLSDAEKLQQSAEAVNVVETKHAKLQTVDLGEVLARTSGVVVRRDGGLGSSARFSLNGLYDDQIRFLLDGVPLDLAGYPFGIADMPVNLIQRVEVYRGVVPVRFGADALGGAVNLVSDQNYETHFGASYQVGSFGTYRATLSGRWRDEATNIIVGATAFLDLAKNDYPVDVQVPDPVGRPQAATVSRFHDAYRASGGTLEAGVLDQPWAKRLLFQGFASTYTKELQNNLVMTVPYGEVHYGESVYGGTGRYEVSLTPSIDLEVIANYAHRIIHFVDASPWVYDWFGHRIRERRVPGEIDNDPNDQIYWQNGAFGRATASYAIAPEHTLRLSLSPNYTTRTGDERIQADPAARDPLSARRHLFTLVSGLEYELDLFDERLTNIAFVKDYVYHASNQELVPGNLFREHDQDRHTQGAGDSVRYEFLPWLSVKASYEYATRLPRPDEVFGDGVLVLANLDLRPEVSHNANLGPRIEYRDATLGDWTLDVNGFLRDSDRLVVLLGNDRTSSYQNVYRARGLGIENAVNWLSPGRFVALDGMLTWQDVRNQSGAGAFAAFKGDRIPNRPYLFASWGVHLRFAGVPEASDSIEPFYSGRYVDHFFRGWESQGLREFKQVVDAQLTHDAGVSWTVDRYPRRVTATFEVDNFTDAKVFDNFGVQRPGRAFYFKGTGEL
jgi:vitamin B12 transporter